MNKYRIYGTVSVDVCVEVVAPTLEDAIEYAEDNYRMEEYCNGTVGCEDGGYEFDDAELTCCCDVEWQNDSAELVEENVEGYDFDDLDIDDDEILIEMAEENED